MSVVICFLGLSWRDCSYAALLRCTSVFLGVLKHCLIFSYAYVSCIFYSFIFLWSYFSATASHTHRTSERELIATITAMAWLGFSFLCVIISGSKTFSKLSRNSNPGSNNNIALPWISFVQDYHHRFWRLAATREPIMIAMERRTRCSPDLSLKTWIIQMKMPSQIEYSVGPKIRRLKILW